MKKGILIIAFAIMFCFLFGCGSDTDSEKAAVEKVPVEKDHIEKVGDAASTMGYDGDAIKKGLREIDDITNDREKAVEDGLDE